MQGATTKLGYIYPLVIPNGETTRFWHSGLGHRLAPGVAANVVDIQDSKWQGLR